MFPLFIPKAGSDDETLCGGIFVKKTVDVCPSAAGYKFFRGFNSAGVTEQLQSATVEQVADACNSRGSSCQGFNSTGSLKQTIQPFVDWVPTISVVCVGLFVPDTFEPDCSVDGYTFFENKDSPGNNLGDPRRESTVRQTAEACDNDNRCEGFNSLGFLKSLVLSESQLCELLLY